MKRMISIFLILTLLLIFIMPTYSSNGKKLIVALGDSITTGEGLENNNAHVSKEAYPQLIGDQINYRVRNLGVSGMTTHGLLEALETDKFIDAIRHADIVLVNIGANDVKEAFLLAVMTGDPSLLNWQPMLVNHHQILMTIQAINPEAQIFYSGYYNPVPMPPIGPPPVLLMPLMDPMPPIPPLPPMGPWEMYLMGQELALALNFELMWWNTVGGFPNYVDILDDPLFMLPHPLALLDTLDSPVELIPNDIHPSHYGHIQIQWEFYYAIDPFLMD